MKGTDNNDVRSSIASYCIQAFPVNLRAFNLWAIIVSVLILLTIIVRVRQYTFGNYAQELTHICLVYPVFLLVAFILLFGLFFCIRILLSRYYAIFSRSILSETWTTTTTDSEFVYGIMQPLYLFNRIWIRCAIALFIALFITAFLSLLLNGRYDFLAIFLRIAAMLAAGYAVTIVAVYRFSVGILARSFFQVQEYKRYIFMVALIVLHTFFWFIAARIVGEGVGPWDTDLQYIMNEIYDEKFTYIITAIVLFIAMIDKRFGNFADMVAKIRTPHASPGDINS